MLMLANEAAEGEEFASTLDGICREGARRMLAVALEAEVDSYIEVTADQLDDDGRRLVVRNGHHKVRKVTTAAGAIEIEAPRINDKRVDPVTGERARFSSSIVPPWCRKSPKVVELLPLLYLHGLSTGDFARLLTSSSALLTGCLRQLSAALSPPGRASTATSRRDRWLRATTSTSGSTGSTSTSAWKKSVSARWS